MSGQDRVAPGKRVRVALIEVRPAKAFQPITASCLKSYAFADPSLEGAVSVDVLYPLLGVDSLEAVAAKAAALQPDLLGLPCYVWSAGPAAFLARRVKALSPPTKVVMGGPEVTARGAAFLERHPEADYAAIGDEGEETFRCLLRHLALGDISLEAVPGLALRLADGRVAASQPADLIDLGRAPSAVRSFEASPAPVVLLEASRGCPFGCKFCDWGLRKMRYVPLARLEAEFRHLAELNCGISLCDADPLMNQRRGLQIIELFLKATAGKNCALGFNTNPTFLTPRIIDALAAAPAKFDVALGIQSTNPTVLTAVDRVFDRPKVESNLRYLNAQAPDLRVFLQLIFGLPGDDWDGFMSSLDWALSFGRPEQLMLFHARALPGAETSAMAGGYGLRHQLEPPYYVLETANLDRQAMCALVRFIFSVGLFWHCPTLSSVFSEAWERIRQPAFLGRRRRVDALFELVRFVEAMVGDLACGVPIAEDDGVDQRTKTETAYERVIQSPSFQACILYALKRFMRERAAALAVPV